MLDMHQRILFWGSASCCAYFIKVNRKTVSSINREKEVLLEAGDCSGSQRKGNVRRWMPLPSNG
jgi:hypothetical protein